MAITKNEVLMFTELEGINSQPDPFKYYTAEKLWMDPHSSDKCGGGRQTWQCLYADSHIFVAL